MMPDEKPISILPSMAQAATLFAALGLIGLFGYGLYLQIYFIVKLVVMAAFLSYLAQVAFVIMEDARNRQVAIPHIISGVAYAAYALAIVFVSVAIIIMIFG